MIFSKMAYSLTYAHLSVAISSYLDLFKLLLT